MTSGLSLPPPDVLEADRQGGLLDPVLRPQGRASSFPVVYNGKPGRWPSPGTPGMATSAPDPWSSRGRGGKPPAFENRLGPASQSLERSCEAVLGGEGTRVIRPGCGFQSGAGDPKPPRLPLGPPVAASSICKKRFGAHNSGFLMPAEGNVGSSRLYGTGRRYIFEFFNLVSSFPEKRRAQRPPLCPFFKKKNQPARASCVFLWPSWP